MTSHIYRHYGWHGTCVGGLHVATNVATMLPQIFIFLLNVDSAHTRIELDNA